MVEFITDAERKRSICRGILEALPEWFEVEESREGYIRGCAEQPFWAYMDGERALGFIALKEMGPYTAGLCVMGVLGDAHRRGIGTALFQAFYDYAKAKGYEFIQVKTVDAGYYEEYDRTRLFYEHLGFRKLEVFPNLWDEANPCLILIKSIR